MYPPSIPARFKVSRPLGVRLDELQTLLALAGVAADAVPNGLRIADPLSPTDIEVLPPAQAGGGMRAAVRITRALPPDLAARLARGDVAGHANQLASLGAIFREDDRLMVGSRLTLYEGDPDWSTNLQLLAFATLFGAVTLFDVLRRPPGDELPRTDRSAWRGEDFAAVEDALGEHGRCIASEHGLLAELPLLPGAVSAMNDPHTTALWRLHSDQPHPDLGGGLMAVLELPYRFVSTQRMHTMLDELNRREMQARALPPHVGAWCVGTGDDCPAYVSFLPNALYRIPGIATRLSLWAQRRARWAIGVLDSSTGG